MNVYTITCPICQKQFKLTVNNPAALTQKHFLCPNCKNESPFFKMIKGIPKPQPVTRSGDGIGKKTIVAHNNMNKVNGYLTVVGSNNKFVLDQNIYIIGRKSSDSTANLQVAPDISISRKHARLTMQHVGDKVNAVIIGLKHDNPIVVNGKEYAAGIPCELKTGDKLKLGTTEMVFTF